MPLYEYRCSKCEKTFEVIQKFSDEPLATHDACGGAVERLLSAPALQFKGSGWYITDYARSGGGKSGEAKGESKGDSKTETKAESKTSDSSGGASSSSGSTGSPAANTK